MPLIECPTCRTTVRFASAKEVPHRPFCSDRCKLIDLGKWFDEEVRLTEEVTDTSGPEGDARGDGLAND